MLNDLKSALTRSRATVLQDAAGLLGLIAMFVVSMSLTDLI